jgi:hypothetical protein
LSNSDLLPVPYMPTRLALVAACLLVGRRAFGRRSAWPGLAVAIAVAAVLLATLRAVIWSFAALETASGALRSVAIYGQRGWWKLALVTCFLVAGAASWNRMRCTVPDGRSVLGAAAVFLQGTLIWIVTLLLEDALLTAITVQPGRYLAEGRFDALALWAYRRIEGNR